MPQAMYERRADGRAGLADLVVLVDEAEVDRRAAGADGAAEARRPGPRSAGSSPCCRRPPPPATMTRARLEVDLRRLACAARGARSGRSTSSSSTFSSTTWPLRVAVRLAHAHHALADGGHLRPAVVVDDRGDDVAAERRADLEQQVLVHAPCASASVWSPICRSVQSAVRPALQGAGHASAPGRGPAAWRRRGTICGLCLSIRSQRTWA